MKPVKFPETNVTYAKNQPQYNSLPAYRSPDGVVISCWELGWYERLKVLFSGKVWLRVWTFNEPLQPLLMETDYPFEEPRFDHGEKKEAHAG